jgi:3D (Asp-Asp-Asp) domain-containing protein
MGQVDRVTQIKAIFNFRKSIRKQKKHINILLMALIMLGFSMVIVYGYARVIKLQNGEYHSVYAKIDKEKEQAIEEKEQVLSGIEMIAKKNQELIEENINLQESLRIAATVGIKPQNYNEPEDVESAVDYSKLEYVGEFEGTAYTPSKEECSNDLGYTASGEPIVPGVSIAVDTDYWSLGTKFYVKGLGYVVAMDTGNAVKGKYRFDFAVFDRDFANELGRKNWDVYLVKE